MIRSTNGIEIMFHQNHSVTKVTKTFERVDQTFCISRMESNSWFIQNIHDSHQTRSYL